MEVAPFLVLVAVVTAIGLWLGILVAPRIGRLAERDDESSEEAADLGDGDGPDDERAGGSGG